MIFIWVPFSAHNTVLLLAWLPSAILSPLIVSASVGLLVVASENWSAEVPPCPVFAYIPILLLESFVLAATELPPITPWSFILPLVPFKNAPTFPFSLLNELLPIVLSRKAATVLCWPDILIPSNCKVPSFTKPKLANIIPLSPTIFMFPFAPPSGYVPAAFISSNFLAYWLFLIPILFSPLKSIFHPSAIPEFFIVNSAFWGESEFPSWILIAILLSPVATNPVWSPLLVPDFKFNTLLCLLFLTVINTSLLSPVITVLDPRVTSPLYK